jgi:hypothetical protein
MSENRIAQKKEKRDIRYVQPCGFWHARTWKKRANVETAVLAGAADKKKTERRRKVPTFIAQMR